LFGRSSLVKLVVSRWSFVVGEERCELILYDYSWRLWFAGDAKHLSPGQPYFKEA
jgi:hypothetical protein